MSFENVVRALQEMGITLEEFDHFLNDYSLGEKETILNEIEQAILQDQMTDLKGLYKRAQNLNLDFVALSAKASFTRLTPEETDKVTDHLYEISIWSYTELCIFLFTMEDLHAKDIIYILNEFLKNGHDMFNSKNIKSILFKSAVVQLEFFVLVVIKNTQNIYLMKLNLLN